MSAEVLVGDGAVRVELDDGVVHVRLHRPEASNGMDVPFLRSLYDALLVVHGIDSTPAGGVELAVLIAANLTATVTRFIAMKTWVFAHGRRRDTTPRLITPDRSTA